MLTEICNYLKNWFEDHKYIGYITIADGTISCGSAEIDIKEGQFFRVIGSVRSDGVYEYGEDDLADEAFYGAIWTMRVPSDVISLSADIDDWMDKYGGAEGVANSPFQSESFGGYSYSKNSGSEGSAAGSWQSVFGSRLSRYKKI